MRVSKLGLVGAAVALASCVAAGAFAQDAGQPPAGGQRRGGGQGRGGFGQGRFGAQLQLVNIPAAYLGKELKLSDDQVKSIKDVQTKFQADQQALFQPADGGQPDFQAMRAKGAELSQKAQKDIEAILKDDQKTGATALVKNAMMLTMLRIPYQTSGDLKLTDEQRTKLAAVAADVQKESAARQQDIQAARQAGDNDKVQELMRAGFGNGQPNEKALAVLTADQKEVVTKYIKDHPRQGGPGGRRFGPGAGAAPQP